MSWSYDGFCGDKVEAGRKLLAEDDAYRDSCDLRLVVEDKDITDELWRLLVGPGGQRRRGLTAKEEVQGMVLFLHSVLRKLQLPFRETLATTHSEPLQEALFDLTEMPVPGPAPGDALAWLLKQVRDTLPVLCVSPKHFPGTYACALGALRSDTWSPATSALLESHQRQLGITRVLTATQQRQLHLLLLPYAAMKAERAPQLVVHAAATWAAARHAADELLAGQPGDPALLLVRATTLHEDLEPAAALQAYGDALAAAQRCNAHLLATKVASTAASMLLRGVGGPEFEAAEVRRLLEAASRGVRLTRPWLWMDHPLKGELQSLQGFYDEAASQRPSGAALLPADPTRPAFRPAVHPPHKCAACGHDAHKLQRCSACKAVHYCSRECQARHWKAGHKQECARLAAASAGGSGAGSGAT